MLACYASARPTLVVLQLMKLLALLVLASFAVFASGCTGGAFLIANSASLAGRYERSTNHFYGPNRDRSSTSIRPRTRRIDRSSFSSAAVRGQQDAEGFIALSERRWRDGAAAHPEWIVGLR